MDNNLLWVDLETTGLNPETDDILEAAFVVTDANLRELASFNTLIRPWCDVSCTTAHEDLDKIVVEMHEKSGLWEELRQAEEAGALPSPDDAVQAIAAFVGSWFPQRHTAVLCGNNVSFDRNFLRLQMFEVEDHLHYRNIDVSSIKELARRWNPDVLESAPVKTGNHRALGDIRDSIAELRHYGQRLFGL